MVDLGPLLISTWGPHPLRGTGPVRTLLMHLTKCEWSKATTSDSLIVAHIDLGTKGFFTSTDAQVKGWLSYTARQVILDGLRARAEGETPYFPRKDAAGIPEGFVPDLEVNRLVLDNKVSDTENYYCIWPTHLNLSIKEDSKSS